MKRFGELEMLGDILGLQKLTRQGESEPDSNTGNNCMYIYVYVERNG